MPVVWRGLSKGDVGMPLGHLQIRDLHNEGDLKALLQDLASTCGTFFNEAPVAAFLQDLPALEIAMPTEGLSASLFRDGQRVRVTIQNTGTRLVELVKAEVLIPEALSGNNNFQEYQPVLQLRYSTEGGVRYVGQGLTIVPSQFPHLGINPLRQMLAPGAEYVPESLGVNLPAGLSPEDEALSIRYTVSSKQLVFGPIATPINKIPIRDV